jgi:pimeloyl-ACP methyl ester carboxylesterase
MNPTRLSQAIARTSLVAALLVAVAACGNDDADSVSATTPRSTTTADQTAAATSPAPTTTEIPATDAPTTTTPATTVPPTTPPPTAPTILLIHGAFAGPSSWDEVVPLLEAEGYDVVVPVNPLLGPSTDAAAVREALADITGDVIVVGHSYGGIPITNAATDDPDVKALVYIAAYVPADGEAFGQLQERVPGQLTPDLLTVSPYTAADGRQGAKATIDPDAFGALFAQDLPAERAEILAAQQMPLDLAALGEPSGPPAWQNIPSWYLIATADQIIPAELARQMATTARSTVEEVDASHAVLVSQPDVVADIIITAAAGL